MISKIESVAIVLPTYNEAGNIGSLLREIESVLSNEVSFHVVVVDDGSPDGTADLVNVYKWDSGADWLHLLTGNKKSGLGNAYLRGFEYVLEELDVDAIFEMDADFSHDPDDLMRFVDGLNEGYDVIIGSRHVSGGDIPDWSFYRRLVSFVGNFLPRFFLNFPVKDCTSGYRAIRCSFLAKIVFERSRISVEGYAFQLSLLNALIDENAKIKEIPIVFHERRRGYSKLGFDDLLEYALEVSRLYFD